MSLYLPNVHNFTLQRYNLFFNSDSYTSNFVSFFLRTTFFVRYAHVGDGLRRVGYCVLLFHVGYGLRRVGYCVLLFYVDYCVSVILWGR